jgi:predicted TIM-barrel fold metal-dependent hydrolase
MLDIDTQQLFPSDGWGSPNDRRGQSGGDLRLPAGTLVFSADNHIELADDIWHQKFPAHLKDKAPRVWRDDGVIHVGVGGKSFLPESFTIVIKHYGRVAGYDSSDMDGRMRDLDAEGMDKELVFPNAMLALLNYPDLEVRELCFRIYNEYLAGLQERYPGRFYGVGLINWWDPAGARRTLTELKSLGLKTHLLPLNAGARPDGQKIDYCGSRMTPVWEEIESSGLPVSHHVGEVVALPCEYNRMTVGYVHSISPFRDLFSRYIFGGILDRHPTLQVGWFEGGINWVASTLQDAKHAHASYRHLENLKIKHEPEYYWRQHMCASFMVDPLGLELIDRIGADKAMWSADYPHNESSFGYSKSSINQVVDAVGVERAKDIVGGNICRFLKV